MIETTPISTEEIRYTVILTDHAKHGGRVLDQFDGWQTVNAKKQYPDQPKVVVEWRRRIDEVVERTVHEAPEPEEEEENINPKNDK